MGEKHIDERVKELVQKELENYGLVGDGSANNATYLHIVNTSSVAITVSLVENTTAAKRTEIGNVSGNLSTVPIDLRSRSLVSRQNYRLSIRPRGSTAAWVTFNSSFTFTESPPGTPPAFMRASFHLSSKGSWTCAGPTFGPATAAVIKMLGDNEESALEDLPGDPIDA